MILYKMGDRHKIRTKNIKLLKRSITINSSGIVLYKAFFLNSNDTQERKIKKTQNVIYSKHNVWIKKDYYPENTIQWFKKKILEMDKPSE